MQKQQLTVVVRVRPLNSSERSQKSFQCVFPLDKKRILLVDPEKFENNILRQNRQHERKFDFDGAFGPSSTQEIVHETTTGPIIDSVIKGYNATVFAYGATGSGKTYTMIGTKDKPGLMTLMTKTLYEKLDSSFQVLLSYMEIYNEVIRDLLNPNAVDLDLLEDENGNIRVPGLSSVRAPNLSRIMQILQEGNLRRTQESTMANKTSSRSHALLQVMIVRNNSLHSKLFMIDLAGSERASNTQNRGIRLKEGAAINRSLLALGNVINSLSSKNTKFVNYRDSKLTRLLKDSLGGTAKTCMIAHVTPSSSNFEETYNTLVYAARAMNITNKPVRNRPASADQVYSKAMESIQRELNSRMKNSQSVNGLTGKGIERNRSRNKSTPILSKPSESGKKNMTGSALFGQLKEQYMTLNEKQKKLRERLMIVNQEAYSIEMALMSKSAIINAWEKQNENKIAESIERLKKDGELQKMRLIELAESRAKIERALKKGDETGINIESKMKTVATTAEQQEVVRLLVRMAQVEAQKISALSDLAIQELIMDRTDNSIEKLQKYETVADKLIAGTLGDVDRRKLEEEYRVIKNQFHYTLLPLKNIQTTLSWNSMLLPKIKSTGSSMDNVITDKNGIQYRNKRREKRESIQLPVISNNKYKHNRGSDSIDADQITTPNSDRLPNI